MLEMSWSPRILVCTFLCATTVTICHAEPIDADSVLDHIQRRYDSTKDYKADFEQETEYRTLNRKIFGKGKVYFSKPGKMLWLYEKPSSQFVLADGTYLYFYQPAEKQITKTALGTAFRSDLPLSFLLGIGQIRKQFRAETVKRVGEDYLVNLSPRKPEAALKMVQLLVSADNYDIKRAQIEDMLGNRWILRFQNIERDIGLKPSVFELNPPKGVDIVEFGS
jgi:outer membrane lipoprotein carrier protein